MSKMEELKAEEAKIDKLKKDFLEISLRGSTPELSEGFLAILNHFNLILVNLEDDIEEEVSNIKIQAMNHGYD